MASTETWQAFEIGVSMSSVVTENKQMSQEASMKCELSLVQYTHLFVAQKS
jgi:hypothetical protein